MDINSSIFFYIDCSKYIDNHSILLYGRQATTRIKYSFFIEDFFPYFGVAGNKENAKKILELESKKIIVHKEFFENENLKRPYEDQYKKKVIKVFTPTTEETKIARKMFDTTYQDDVPYERVFRIAKNIYGFFIIDDVKKLFKQKPIAIVSRGKNKIETSEKYYVTSHLAIHGF